MPLLGLKIDVDTYRGTVEGLPSLFEILQKYGICATFLFSLGPDHTGRALRRALRPGFLRKVSRTSVVEHYGIKTLLYGTLLPGPDIGLLCTPLLRQARDAGFDVGIHAWDHVEWQDRVATGTREWTYDQMNQAHDRFRAVFGTAARVHGAAGWQMNAHAYAIERELGYGYASDGRGHGAFVPVVEGSEIPVPQYPSTLPTLDELVGIDGITAGSAHQRLLQLTENRREPQVFTLHAELEGMKWRPAFDLLLQGWKRQGFLPCSLTQMHAETVFGRLPRHRVAVGTVPGRSGTLAIQGERVG